MRPGLFAILISILSFIACKKEGKENTPVPFLTEKIWTLDTITINPPANYNNLTSSDQFAYRSAVGWLTGAKINFRENSSVTCDGDHDFGYYQWRMIGNNKDIEVLKTTSARDTLFDWTADSQQFTYKRTLTPSLNCTFIYK